MIGTVIQADLEEIIQSKNWGDLRAALSEFEAADIAEIMIETLKNKDDASKKQSLRAEVKALCERFPVPEVFV